MWYNKEKLEQLSISDLYSIREYCLYQVEARSWEIDKWNFMGRIIIDELEKRINEIFIKQSK